MRAGPCEHRCMSLFRKQPTAAPSNVPVEREPSMSAPQLAPPPLFDGPNVDIAAVYREGKLSTEELDRVVRAGELLHLLPSKASHTRAVVDATLRAFSVDRTKIVEAASKQLDTLERFIRFSHTQTQRVLDINAQRIAELEAEIERCRQASAVATQEGEERARTVNNELLRVQRVLEFFGDEIEELQQAAVVDLDETVVKHSTDNASSNSQSAATK